MDLKPHIEKQSAGDRNASRVLTTVHGLHLDLQRCLRGHKPRVACESCVTACPISALATTAGGIASDSSCIACGLCAAACPTGAIAVDGFAPPQGQHVRLRIECSRVPASEQERGSWTVPCIAGLRLAMLEAVGCDPTQSTGVTLVDRGLCAHCPGAKGGDAVQLAYGRLAADLKPPETRNVAIAVSVEPLLESAARPFGQSPPTSRRQFLHRLMQPASAPTVFIGIREDRAALARLAASAGRQLSAQHFPEARLSPACRDHGICAASCPTKALRYHLSGADDEIRSLVFDPVECIGCRRCMDVCPEQAMTIAPAGSAAEPGRAVVLRQNRLSLCAKCGDTFTPSNDTDVCPSCRKGNALFHDLFRQHQREDSQLPLPNESDKSEKETVDVLQR